MIKELVEHIVKSLVANQHDVFVTVIKDGGQSTIQIKVNPEDRGKLIGREGQTIKSIRAIIGAVAASGKRVSLEIVD